MAPPIATGHSFFQIQNVKQKPLGGTIAGLRGLNALTDVIATLICSQAFAAIAIRGYGTRTL